VRSSAINRFFYIFIYQARYALVLFYSPKMFVMLGQRVPRSAVTTFPSSLRGLLALDKTHDEWRHPSEVRRAIVAPLLKMATMRSHKTGPEPTEGP
jgi:hypothetical protein